MISVAIILPHSIVLYLNVLYYNCVLILFYSEFSVFYYVLFYCADLNGKHLGQSIVLNIFYE